MEAAGGARQIAGYSYHDIIAYYLLTMISRAFSSMPGLASGIARDIRDGTVKKYLIQPIDMLGFPVLYRLAHKLVYYAVAAAPFALVFYLCRGYFPGWPDGPTLAGLPGLAGDVVPAGFLPGGDARHDRLLVPGGQFAVVRFMLIELLLLRPHVSDRHAAGRLGRRSRADPAAIPGLLSRGRFPGQGRGPGAAGSAWCAQLAWVVFFMIVAAVAFHFGVRHYSGYRRMRMHAMMELTVPPPRLSSASCSPSPATAWSAT